MRRRTRLQLRKKYQHKFIFTLMSTFFIVVNYINKTTVEQISMYYYGEGVNIMIYCYICKKKSMYSHVTTKVNVVTCESIDFCSHMWLHWLLNIMFCSSFCVLLSFHKIFNQIFCSMSKNPVFWDIFEYSSIWGQS